MKVVKINRAECGENVKTRINEAMRYAENNSVDNVVIVMIGANGDVVDCWANNSKPFVVVGALESIKCEFMDSCIERR